mgnify:CR=1 FL=1
MTAEIILSISLLFSLGILALSQYLNGKERKDLLRHILAKNLGEVNSAEAIDKMSKEKEEQTPDLIPIQDADDDLFSKMVKEQNKLTPK